MRSTSSIVSGGHTAMLMPRKVKGQKAKGKGQGKGQVKGV